MSATLRMCLALLFFSLPAAAETPALRLNADPALVSSGLMKHLLPRFSLKTGQRVELVEAGGDAMLARTGDRAAITGPEGTYFITTTNPMAERFADWLLSDIGRNTIAAFPPFQGAAPQQAASAETGFDGNAALGERLALTHCGRCHVVNEKNRQSGIGSTPSFGALRTFPDWTARFEGFFALNPHPSFTQIADVTPPFPKERPAHIVPVELTQDELDAILAFVTELEPADLGAPVQSQ